MKLRQSKRLAVEHTGPKLNVGANFIWPLRQVYTDTGCVQLREDCTSPRSLAMPHRTAAACVFPLRALADRYRVISTGREIYLT